MRESDSEGVGWRRIDLGPNLAAQLLRDDAFRVDPLELPLFGEKVYEVAPMFLGEPTVVPVACAWVTGDDIVLSASNEERTQILSVQRSSEDQWDVFLTSGEQLGSIAPMSEREFTLFDSTNEVLGVIRETARERAARIRRSPRIFRLILALVRFWLPVREAGGPPSRFHIFAGGRAVGELTREDGVRGLLMLAGDQERRVDRAFAAGALVAVIAWGSRRSLRSIANRLEQVLAEGKPQKTKALLRLLIKERR